MSFANLSRIGLDKPLRLLLVHAGDAESITWAGLVQPLRLCARALGPDALQLDVRTPEQVAAQGGNWHIALLVADETEAPLRAELCRAVIERCRSAPFWGGVGAAVLWLADAGVMDGVRIALPWALYADAEAKAERAILTPHLFDIDGPHITCCGGAASIDFSLTLIETIFGADVQALVKEALCVDKVRGKEERQRVALQARFGVLQPKLSEAVTLMEANIEEPLTTDEIAQHVCVSRRQLERIFKQYLNRVPSQYYLELRLNKARQMLMQTSKSIIQIGLSCGFSSGPHFSSAYRNFFGATPREDRNQRRSSSPFELSSVPSERG